MSKILVESYKSAHRSILGAIDDIQLSLRDYNQARPKLRALGNILLAHLGRQNNEILDRLECFFVEDKESSKMLEFLRHDLKEIKIKYLLFTDKHSGELGNINARGFIRDFREFSRDVINRIQTEEEHLIPMLEKLPEGMMRSEK